MKNTAIMCVYNEAPKRGFESYLEKSVDSVLDCINKKTLSNAVFVDDGSTDKSYELIKNKTKGYSNIAIKRHEKNKGKAKAFLTGLKECSKYNPDVVITLDADMTDFKPDYAKKLSKAINSKTDMAIALSGTLSCGITPIEFSGIRAIKFNSLKRIWEPDWIKHFDYVLPKHGYRLEKILNKMIPEKKKDSVIFLPDVLHTRGAGMGNYHIDDIIKGFKSLYI